MVDTKYKEDLEINKDSLDYEWSRHTALFVKWAEQEVEAMYERDKNKEKLELIKAQVDKQVRESAAESGRKVTETVVSSEILMDDKYQDINSDFIESVKTARVMGIATSAFEHRKKALEKLTDLWLAGYWSEPKIDSFKKKQAQDIIEQESISKFKKLNPKP